MCIGGRLGLALASANDHAVVALFSESNGRFLVEVRPQDCAEFETHLGTSLPWKKIGTVSADPSLVIHKDGQAIVQLSVADLVSVWNRSANQA
jgi:phosphoribosylformylglycinamidine (FGAM) synthase-like enzyme